MATYIIISSNIVAFHPGYYIQELIDSMGFSRRSFARELNVTFDYLDSLLRGEQELTADLANRLAKLVGTSTSYWLNLQKTYNQQTSKAIARKNFRNRY